MLHDFFFIIIVDTNLIRVNYWFSHFFWPLTEQLTVIAGLLIRHGIQSSIPLGGTSIDVHSTAERIVSEAVNELRGESMTDKVEAESVKTKESSLVF